MQVSISQLRACGCTYKTYVYRHQFYIWTSFSLSDSVYTQTHTRICVYTSINVRLRFCALCTSPRRVELRAPRPAEPRGRRPVSLSAFPGRGQLPGTAAGCSSAGALAGGHCPLPAELSPPRARRPTRKAPGPTKPPCPGGTAEDEPAAAARARLGSSPPALSGFPTEKLFRPLSTPV